MLYQHLTDTCFTQGSDGVSRKQAEALLAALAERTAALRSHSDPAAAPLLMLPSRQDDLAIIEQTAARIRSAFNTVVVAATGGSASSGRALTHLAKLGATPSFHYLENIDPDVMDEVLAHIDCSKTCFLIISKSGTTAETLAQFFVLFDYAKAKLGKKAAEHFFIITLPGDNPLRRMATTHALTTFDHEPVCGRFSVLSNVGLLPAAIAGLDIRALRRGAQTVIKQMETLPLKDYPPALGAALQYAFIEKNRPMSVLLPYAERLATFSCWWRQGWAESLGKRGRGSTPVTAMGTTDQHSQLQLYLDGPRDKFFTMITLARAGKGGRIAAEPYEELTYLRGKTLGDIMQAEQKATFETLVRHHMPVRLIALDVLKEEQMGALLMHFMLEIIFTAHLLDVNPFDQPAVEEGKQLARDYLLKGAL